MSPPSGSGELKRPKWVASRNTFSPRYGFFEVRLRGIDVDHGLRHGATPLSSCSMMFDVMISGTDGIVGSPVRQLGMNCPQYRKNRANFAGVGASSRDKTEGVHGRSPAQILKIRNLEQALNNALNNTC